MLNVSAIAFYILTYGIIEQWASIAVYAGDSFLTLVYICHSLYSGASKKQIAVIILTLSSLSVYYVFLLLYYLFGVSDYKYKLGVFLLTELFTIGCVLVSGLKHGLFKNEQSML